MQEITYLTDKIMTTLWFASKYILVQVSINNFQSIIKHDMLSYVDFICMTMTCSLRFTLKKEKDKAKLFSLHFCIAFNISI